MNKVRDGAKAGFIFGAALACLASIGAVVRALDNEPQHGSIPSFGVLLFIYLVGGAVAGGIWGALQRFSTSCLTTFLVWTVAGLPASIMLRVALFGPGNWSSRDFTVVAVAVLWAVIVSIATQVPIEPKTQQDDRE